MEKFWYYIIMSSLAGNFLSEFQSMIQFWKGHYTSQHSQEITYPN